MEGRLTLLVEFYGNSDTNSDTRDKSWFYFGVVGVRDSRNMKYSQILFRWKNANIYRKFLRDKKYRPYVAVRENREKGTNGNCNEWKTLYITKFTYTLYKLGSRFKIRQFRQNLYTRCSPASIR